MLALSIRTLPVCAWFRLGSTKSNEHLPLFVGVLVVLGLGTAVRLILECCHQRIMQRNLRRLELQPISSAYEAPLQIVTQSSDVQVKFLSTLRSSPRDDICERILHNQEVWNTVGPVYRWMHGINTKIWVVVLKNLSAGIKIVIHTWRVSQDEWIFIYLSHYLDQYHPSTTLILG